MATYTVPEQLTEQQREAYAREILPDDAESFLYFVWEHYPAVYDAAVLDTGRVYTLRNSKIATPKPQGATQ